MQLKVILYAILAPSAAAAVIPRQGSYSEDLGVRSKRDPGYDLKQLVLPVEVTKATEEKRDPSHNTYD